MIECYYMIIYLFILFYYYMVIREIFVEKNMARRYGLKFIYVWVFFCDFMIIYLYLLWDYFF